MRIINKVYCLLLIFVFAVVTFVPSNVFAADRRYEDTDLISTWRVTTSGSIYTPISVTTLVTISDRVVPDFEIYEVTRRQLYSQTLASYFSVYPNAQFGPAGLTIRGSGVSLPIQGTYIHDPIYRVRGYYNSDVAVYSIFGSGSGSGVTMFITGSGGYQFDTTAQVDFIY